MTHNPESQQAIAQRLILLRKALGMSQKQFYEACKIARGAYSLAETGNRRLSLDMAIAIAKKFGVTLDWIYFGNTAGLTSAKISDLEKASCT